MLLVVAVLLLRGDETRASSRNSEVLAYARSQLGHRVGDGECSALVEEALRQAGTSRGPGDWGDPVPLGDARPGDILQFDGCVFVRRRILPGGGVLTLTIQSPRHMAIVAQAQIRRGRPIFTVIHQNSGFEQAEEATRKVVQEGVFNLAEMRRGTVRAYRPVDGPGQGQPEGEPDSAPGADTPNDFDRL